MELGDSGLKLTYKEADDLSRVLYAVKHLHPTRALGLVSLEATPSQRLEATSLARDIRADIRSHGAGPTGETVIEPANFPAVFKSGELALANTQAVVVDMCTPSIPDGFYPGLRANALGALQTTAQVCEVVRPFVPIEEMM